MGKGRGGYSRWIGKGIGWEGLASGTRVGLVVDISRGFGWEGGRAGA